MIKQTITNKTTNNNPKSLKNKLIIPLLLLSLALIFSFTAGTVSAASTSSSSGSNIVYVNDTGGSDDNNGTSWQWAKKSIKNATGTVNANGTVNIANGRYTGVNNTNITIDRNMIIKGQSQTGTIINGSNSAQIFHILSGVSVIIRNLTVANGNNTEDMGGAIYNAGNLTISGCKFTDNTAAYGGAIFNDGNLTVSGCKFTGNTVQSYGGAITNGGNLTVSNSTFTGNTAQDARWSVGGAIYNYGSSIISNSTFIGNTAANGGAIHNQDSGLTISGSTFTNNTGKQGGAIYNYNGSLNVTNSNFDSNTATGTSSNGDGGAIYNEGTTSLSDCIFTSNYADDSGGAIYNENNLTLTGCTFTGNDADDGGAIYNADELTVTDSTFTGNDADNCCGGGAIYNADELTVTDSTFTGNEAIDSDGGAIYNADELTVTDCNFTGNDADDGGAIYNDERGTMTVIGCNFTGNKATDSDGGAIYNEYEMTVADSTFTGNDADDVGGAICSKEGMTVTGCTFTANKAEDGGAIYSKGEMTVTGCTFTGNEAEYGGAIYNADELTVTGSTFKNNSAEYGGAIYSYSEMTINFCRIVGNNANGNGDAVYFGNGEVIKLTTVKSLRQDPVNARYNWWGSNKPDFGKLICGDVDYTPWLYMTIAANPTTIKNGKTSLITVSFNNLFNGTTRTDLDPATGHIPDGSPVNFQTDLGTIGCKSIDKTTTGGIATAILTATELAGIAHLNATTDNQTLFINVTITPKAGLYLTVTPSKANPVAGDTVLYTLKVGNKGPDAAKDVVMTYVVPEGLEFAGATVDVGTYTYDPATRTITWTIGDVPVGDPYMWLSLRVAQSGHYLINPVLITSTYDPTISIDTQSITVNAAAKTTVNAASKTIPLQKTGLPLAGFVLAILAVFGGLVPKRK